MRLDFDFADAASFRNVENAAGLEVSKYNALAITTVPSVAVTPRDVCSVETFWDYLREFRPSRDLYVASGFVSHQMSVSHLQNVFRSF